MIRILNILASALSELPVTEEVKTLLIGSNLSSQPANFNITSEFEFSGGELVGSGTNNDWTSFAYFNKLSSQERQSLIVNFHMNSLSSFRIIKFSDINANSGKAVELDFVNGNIIIYNYAYPAIPSVSSSTPISIAINTNHAYTVELRKEDLEGFVRLTNNTTQESQTISTIGVMRGRPGVMHVAGNLSFTGMYYYALNPSNPKMLMIGDSYVDGYSLPSEDRESRWTYQIYNHLNQNAMISGWGGNSSLDILNRDVDYTNITPDNVILVAGLNDNNYSNWVTRLNQLISIFEGKGTKVYLITYPPAYLTQAYSAGIIPSMNSYILSSVYPFFDIAGLLTLGGDRVTRDDSLFLPDLAHPNVSGHNILYGDYLANIYPTLQ